MTNAALDPFGKIPEFKYCAVRDHSAAGRRQRPPVMGSVPGRPRPG